MTAARRAKMESKPTTHMPAAQFRETGEMGHECRELPFRPCPSPIYPSKDGPWGQVGHETLTKYSFMANLTVTKKVTHHLLTPMSRDATKCAQVRQRAPEKRGVAISSHLT